MSELRWMVRLSCDHHIASDEPITEGTLYCPDRGCGLWQRVVECWSFRDPDLMEYVPDEVTA